MTLNFTVEYFIRPFCLGILKANDNKYFPRTYLPSRNLQAATVFGGE